MADDFLDKDEVELNMTPLIDCVFLLLIFFMVTTVFTSASGLKIELPKATNWQKIKETKLFLSLGEDGKMELNGNVVTKPSLASLLMQEKNRTHAVTLIIKADQKSQHVHTLDIMEIAKNLGIETISLAVEQASEGD